MLRMSISHYLHLAGGNLPRNVDDVVKNISKYIDILISMIIMTIYILKLQLNYNFWQSKAFKRKEIVFSKLYLYLTDNKL